MSNPTPAPAPSPTPTPGSTGSKIVAWAKAFKEAVTHGSKGTAALLLISAVIYVGGWAIQSGWLNRLTPAPPTIEPVTVTLEGPAPEAVTGSSYIVAATISGPAGKADWELTPASGAMLTPAGDGRSARFTAREPGSYTIRVLVPGDGMQVAKASLSIDALAISEPPHPEEPTPGPAGPTDPPASPPPAAPTIGQLTMEAIENVDSPDRQAEARVISGSIKILRGKVQAGLVDPRANLIDELEDQAKEALSARYDAWAFPFFGTLKAGFEGLKEHGILTAAGQLPALDEVDAALSGAH